MGIGVVAGVGGGGGEVYTTSQTPYLYMKRLNKTESPIFALLYVLCFQRQHCRYFFCSNFRIDTIKSTPAGTQS